MATLYAAPYYHHSTTPLLSRQQSALANRDTQLISFPFTPYQAKGNTEGQRQKKLDDNPDIIKPKTVGKEVGKMIMDTRQKMEPKLDRAQLAQKAMITPSELALWENGTATPDQKKFGQLERALNVCLQGTKFGQPKFGAKKK